MFVFFDFDATLFDDETAQRAGVAGFYGAHREEMKLPEEEFQAAWRTEAQRFFDRYLAGEFTFKEQRRRRLEVLLGRALADGEADALYDEYYVYYRQHWKLFPDVEPCLQAIKRRGIISNGDSGSQRTKMAAVDIPGRFDPVLISGDLGIHKPDARIFEEACRRAGVDARDCVYVGDLLDGDAIGARDAGMTGVWLNRRGAEAAAAVEIPEGVKVITSLEELPGREFMA